MFSLMGWIHESIYCTLRTGKWENRGFLFGPICPIYGIGAIIISIIMNTAIHNGARLIWWQVFIISVVGSAILEYVTSWALEKAFHAMWWDYSDYPFNIKGRISLFTSLGFGLAGLLIVYVLSPFTMNLIGILSPIMIELIAVIFTFLLAMDLAITVTNLHNFDKLVVNYEKAFNDRMESFVDTTVSQSDKIKEEMMKRAHFVTEQVSSFGGAMRHTVKRVYSFRGMSGQTESVKNILLKKISSITKRNG